MAALDSWPARSFARRRGNGPLGVPGDGGGIRSARKFNGLWAIGDGPSDRRNVNDDVSGWSHRVVSGGLKIFSGSGRNPPRPGTFFLRPARRTPLLLPSRASRALTRGPPKPRVISFCCSPACSMASKGSGSERVIAPDPWSLSLALAFARRLAGVASLRRSPSISVALRCSPLLGPHGAARSA